MSIYSDALTGTDTLKSYRELLSIWFLRISQDSIATSQRLIFDTSFVKSFSSKELWSIWEKVTWSHSLTLIYKPLVAGHCRSQWFSPSHSDISFSLFHPNSAIGLRLVCYVIDTTIELSIIPFATLSSHCVLLTLPRLSSVLRRFF